MTRTSVNRGPWRVPRTGLVAAIVTFLVLGTSAGAYAYWSAQASVTSTAKAGSIAVSLAGFPASVQNTFVNDTRTRTGSVTVTNSSTSTSTTQIPVSVTLGYVAGGSSVLASNLDVTMWGPTSAINCTSAATPGGTIKTGTWASIPPMTSTLSAGQASTWCVRASNVERSGLASASGTLTIQPRVTATLTAGSWTASASATSTQNTQYIFPAAVPDASSWFSIKTAGGKCFGVSGTGGVGASLVPLTCSVVSAQAFAFAGADANGYLTVTPKGALSLRLDTAGSTAAGSSVTLQGTTGGGSQGWQLQQAAPGAYQIVNKISGLCLGQSAAVPFSSVQDLCDGSAGQRFTLVPLSFDIGLTCTDSGNNGRWSVATFAWSTGLAIYTVQADKDTSVGVNWQTIGLSAAPATSIEIQGNLPLIGPIGAWPAGTYDVRLIDANGGVVALSTITVRSSGGLGCV